MALFHSFYAWVIFHCIHIPHLLYSVICWWNVRLLPCLSYCEQGFCEQWGRRHLFKWALLSFLDTPRSGIAGSHGSCFQFSEDVHSVLHRGCTKLLSHQRCWRAPFSPHHKEVFLTICNGCWILSDDLSVSNERAYHFSFLVMVNLINWFVFFTIHQ